MANSSLCREKYKMLYPQSLVDSLRGHFLVSEVVGRHVALRRHGREFTGLCPFHKEKTPSFTVNDEKAFYHCFGCGAHGDVIGFVKEYDGIGYREAIEKLAADAGMALPKPTAEEAKKEIERSGLQDVTEAACAWFESQLQSASGYAARDYLLGRGLKEETIHRFRVGFAPDSQDAMVAALKSEGITETQMFAAGLIIQPEGRAAYAKFRARIMFPIRDKRSKVVAFGGRVLPGMAHADAPKYLNSPETELFKKGQMLYNYDLARKPALESAQVLLCEGYMDVIMLAQAGITHAVAPLGTAVTEAQLQQLWQLSDAPSLCLDGDSAGSRAMQRASELALPLLMPGKTLKFVRLPQGEDPDSFVRAQGALALTDLVAKAPSLADTVWQQACAAIDNSPEKRSGLEQHVMALADQIQNATVKTHFKSYFKQQLWALSSQRPLTKNKQRGVAGSRPLVNVVLPHLPNADDSGSRLDRAAASCLELAITYPRLLDDADREEFLSCMQLRDVHLHALRQVLMTLLREQPGLFEGEQTDFLAAMTAKAETTSHEAALRLRAMVDEKTSNNRIHAPASSVHRSWNQSVNAYHMALLSSEITHLEQELGADLSDSSLARIMAYKQQMEQLERERDQLILDEMQEMA